MAIWTGVLKIGLLASALAGALALSAQAQTVVVDQGADWTPDVRESFYVQDQGSQIMPLKWMQALKLPDGSPFLGGSLARYGYLVNPNTTTPNVPIGFTVASTSGVDIIGMTCSACHTRQITVKETAYRIDGGPAIVDFQSFLSDLDIATKTVTATPAAFDAFATSVLGSAATDPQKQTLKVEFETWTIRYGALIKGSLPDPAWGPSRLDAVSMIFNRLAGLDLGAAPTFLIEDNIAKADAPARYPFLWNAAIQDKTQWPGFADNGSDILGLARNLGEVYGVFGTFHPIKDSGLFNLNRNYLKMNSANFAGLSALEGMIKKIGAPRWPWQIDQQLAAHGADLFNSRDARNGCVACHGITPGKTRPIFNETWATPIVDVGTDSRECSVLTRQVQTGVLNGAQIPFAGGALGGEETAFKVLETSVIGAILQNKLPFLGADVQRRLAPSPSMNSASASPSLSASSTAALPADLQSLRGAFNEPAAMPESATSMDNASRELSTEDNAAPAKSGCAYESRVMEGIWAAAPYLHNGSVQSLAELLKPASERAASFKVGPAYDIETVGLAPEQTMFDFTLETTGCEGDGIDSGNSRCGHEFGTTLSPADKRALLEYLKTL